jgi:hypothetical protein
VVIRFLKLGIKLRRRDKGRDDVRVLISKGSLTEGGLLVIKSNKPKGNIQVDLIVIPNDFSLSFMTLMHNENHPSIQQMMGDSAQRFFLFLKVEECF